MFILSNIFQPMWFREQASHIRLTRWIMHILTAFVLTSQIPHIKSVYISSHKFNQLNVQKVRIVPINVCVPLCVCERERERVIVAQVINGKKPTKSI